jgi:hypothetical protein
MIEMKLEILSNKRKKNDFTYNVGKNQNWVYLSQNTYEQLLNNITIHKYRKA